MGVADSGKELAIALLASPFFVALIWALARAMTLIYNSTKISGDGGYAQTQKTVYEGSLTALSLVELASSIETWVLLIVFLGAVYTAIMSRSGF